MKKQSFSQGRGKGPTAGKKAAKPASGKKSFSKKSETKGWSRKSNDTQEKDYRFEAPGSRGKLVKSGRKESSSSFDKPTFKTKRISSGNKGKDFTEAPFDKGGKQRRNPVSKEGISGFRKGKNPSDKTRRYSSKSDFSGDRVEKSFGEKGFRSPQKRTSPSKIAQGDKDAPKRTSRTFSGVKKEFGSSKPTNSFKEKKGFSNSGSEPRQPLKSRFERKADKLETAKAAAKEKSKKIQKPSAERDLDGGVAIRLNRYISNAGICSRREADEMITAGLVSINDVVVTELGTKVSKGDVVKFNGSRLSVEEKVYILLNKPKDAITTFDDPEGRNTVMDLFEGKIKERVFPVGRLDRNTTGVLLLTNDGEMAQRLMHPKYEVHKVYKATLDKPLKPSDLWTLSNGVILEDGPIKPDAIAAPDSKNKNVVGIEIHSGKNRIIHRMFEHLNYKVDKLDRVLYAGLEKGKLKRGEWRPLTEKELKSLKRQLRLK